MRHLLLSASRWRFLKTKEGDRVSPVVLWGGLLKQKPLINERLNFID